MFDGALTSSPVRLARFPPGLASAAVSAPLSFLRPRPGRPSQDLVAYTSCIILPPSTVLTIGMSLNRRIDLVHILPEK